MIRLAISVDGRTEEEFVKNVLAPHLRCEGGEPYPIKPGGRGGSETVEQLEERIESAVDSLVGQDRDRSTVFAYVQRHEFEGLLFSGVDAFRVLPDAVPGVVEALSSIRAAFPTPEDIDDGIETAPSKRIAGVFGAYRRALHGPLVAEEMGLAKIRDECPRFHAWMERIESLGDP